VIFRRASPPAPDRPTLEGVPDDVAGQPFPDGEWPDDRDHGAADEAFAAVVLDEAFVEAARIHEPTAEERMLYATLERAAAEAGLGEGPEGVADGTDLLGFDRRLLDELAAEDEGRFDRSDYTRYAPSGAPDGGPDGAPDGGPDAEAPPPAPSGRRGGVPGRPPARWQRPVACVLAMVMGLSMIAFALIAVQRAGSAQRPDPVPTPPATNPGGDGETGDGRAVTDASVPRGSTSAGSGTGDPARVPAGPAAVP
jgi:hypothetical protein